MTDTIETTENENINTNETPTPTPTKEESKADAPKQENQEDTAGVDPELLPYYDRESKKFRPDIANLLKEERESRSRSEKRADELRKIISKGDKIYDKAEDYPNKAQFSKECQEYIEKFKDDLYPDIQDISKISARYGETEGQFTSKVIDLVENHKEYMKTHKSSEELAREYTDNAKKILNVKSDEELTDKITKYSRKIEEDRFISKESKEIYQKIIDRNNPHALDTLKLLTEVIDSNLSAPAGLPPIIKAPTIGDAPKTSRAEINRQVRDAYAMGDHAEVSRLMDLL